MVAVMVAATEAAKVEVARVVVATAAAMAEVVRAAAVKVAGTAEAAKAVAGTEVVKAAAGMVAVETAAETAAVATVEATAERRSPHRHSNGPRASHPRGRICNPECNHPSQPRASPSSSMRGYRCIASRRMGTGRQTEGSCNQSACSLMSSD